MLNHLLRLASITTFAVAVMCLIAPAQAEQSAPADNAVTKSARQLGRGLGNIVTGPLEIPANIIKVKDTNGDVAGVTYGTLRGVWRCLVREGVGVFEVVTFPMRFKPIVTPEFTAQNGLVNAAFSPDEMNTISVDPTWEVQGLRLDRD